MISVLQKVVDDSSLVVELLFCQAASEVTPGLNFSYIDHLYSALAVQFVNKLYDSLENLLL